MIIGNIVYVFESFKVKKEFDDLTTAQAVANLSGKPVEGVKALRTKHNRNAQGRFCKAYERFEHIEDITVEPKSQFVKTWC